MKRSALLLIAPLAALGSLGMTAPAVASAPSQPASNYATSGKSHVYLTANSVKIYGNACRTASHCTPSYVILPGRSSWVKSIIVPSRTRAVVRQLGGLQNYYITGPKQVDIYWKSTVEAHRV